MSIKGKLLILLFTMGLLLVTAAGFMAWNVGQVSREVDVVGSGIEYLHDISGIRERFYRQIHALAHHFLYHEEGTKRKFDELHIEIKGLFRKLQEASRNEQSNASRGSRKGSGEHDLAHLKKIEENYGALIEQSRGAFELNITGDPAAARRAIDRMLDRRIENEFYREIDETIDDRTDDLLMAYDRILLKLGAVPWTGNAYIRPIQGTRLSIRYYLAVGRLSMSLNREINEFVQYIASGSVLDLTAYEDAGRDTERALRDCKRTIHEQIAFEMEGEAEQLNAIRDLERELGKMSALMGRVHALKRSGNGQQAFALTETQLKPHVDGTVLPKLERIMVESRAEIALGHRILLRSIYIAGIVNVSIIIVLAILLFLLTYRLIDHMLVSIRRLTNGANIVGRGDLDHAIFVDTNDELGRLAVSFNRMTASLKDSNEDLRFFIFSLSHDLRSPLLNIKGFSGELSSALKELDAVLERSSGGILPGDRVRLQSLLRNEIPATLGFLEGSAERINELVKAVLKLSLVGQTALKPEPIVMDAFVRSSLARFNEKLNANGITVHIGDLPDITADRSAMEEIMGNVIDNAMKYLSPDRPGMLEITGQRTDRETVLHVRDNGRGIAQDDLPKIFGLFRRVGEQDIPGDGMGLAYVKALVRRHGGRIWCTSEKGAGTTFSISFPVARPLL